MNSYSILLFAALICYSSASKAKVKFPNCADIKGVEIVEGRDFIPPENHCIHCLCFKGTAKFCESLPCENPPPAGCKKWTEYCCKYTCHDGEYNEKDGYHVGGRYDSEENTNLYKFKKYARNIWDHVINFGKRTPTTAKPALIAPVEESTGKHQNTPVHGPHKKLQNHPKHLNNTSHSSAKALPYHTLP